jgi:hypothetical protein
MALITHEQIAGRLFAADERKFAGFRCARDYVRQTLSLKYDDAEVELIATHLFNLTNPQQPVTEHVPLAVGQGVW